MGVNLRDFKIGLKEDIHKVINKIEQVEKDVVNEIMEALLEPKSVGGTPKKTGWLRSNYIVTTDTKTDEVVGSQKNVDTSKRDQSISELNQEQNLISKNEIWINNNTPYGPKVNSNQRFREASIQRGVERLNKERKI